MCCSVVFIPVIGDTLSPGHLANEDLQSLVSLQQLSYVLLHLVHVSDKGLGLVLNLLNGVLRAGVGVGWGSGGGGINMWLVLVHAYPLACTTVLT